MRKPILTAAAVAFVAAFASCKGNNSESDAASTEADSAVVAPPATMDHDKMNHTTDTEVDSNAAGTTSGEMEQVP